MHFAARSALLASCLALRVHALPVTYSVVDVDGGSAAGGDATDSPATVYHTVTKSSEAKEPEATTVSITIVSTADASPKSANASEPSSTAAVSTSSPSPSAKKSAQASSSSTATSSAPHADETDALSVLESAMSTYPTQKPSSISSPPAKPTTIHAPPPPSAAPHAEDHDSEKDCDAASVTVTAEEAASKAQGETVTLRSTTTVTPAAAPTSYYDDGMWHTRYAIKPSAAPELAPKAEEAAPKHEEKSVPVLPAAANATGPSTNATLHARRQVKAVAPTSTLNQAVGTGASQVVGSVASGVPIVGRQIHGSPAFGQAAGTGAPEMLVHPFRPEATGIAARAQPTGFVTGLVARAEPTGYATGIVARAEPTGFASGLVARAEPSGFATGIIARAEASGIAARALPTGDAAAENKTVNETLLCNPLGCHRFVPADNAVAGRNSAADNA